MTAQSGPRLELCGYGNHNRNPFPPLQNDGLTVKLPDQAEFVTAVVSLVQTKHSIAKPIHLSHRSIKSPTPSLPYHTCGTDLFHRVQDLQSYLRETVELTDSDESCRIKVLRARLNSDETTKRLRRRADFSNPYTAPYTVTNEGNVRNG